MKKEYFFSLFVLMVCFTQAQTKPFYEKEEEWNEKKMERNNGSLKPYTVAEIEAIQNEEHENQNSTGNRFFGEGYQWSCLGPYNFDQTRVSTSTKITGSILDLEFKDTIPDKYYNYIRVLSSSGGVFENPSANTWNHLTANLTCNIGAFASSPLNDNTILVGTGRRRAYSPGTGFYYTSDRAVNWFPANVDITPPNIMSIVYNKDNPNKVAAGTDIGFYFSYNGGTQWERQSRFIDTIVTKIFIENTDYDIDENEKPKAFYLSVRNGGLYRYGIAGYEYIPIGGINPAIIQHVEIEFNPHNSNTVYALVYFEPNTSQLFKSYNHGASWFPCIYQSTGANFDAGSQYFSNTICIDPNDTNRVVVGTLYLSTSVNGYSFTDNTSSDYHMDVTKIVQRIGFPGQFWVTSDGGILLYNSLDNTFSSGKNNLPISESYDFEVSRTETTPSIVLSTQDNGTVYFHPTQNWTQQNRHFSDGNLSGLNPFSNDTMVGFEGLTTNLCYLSYTVNGTTWHSVPSDDITTPQTVFSFDYFSHDYRRPTQFCYSDHAIIYRTTDFFNWTPVTFPFPETPGSSIAIREFKFSPSGISPTEYALTNGGTDFLFVKRPSDMVATNISNNAIGGGYAPAGIRTVYPRDNWIIAFRDGTDPLLQLRRIVFSQDYGATFTPYAGNLPVYLRIYDVLINPYDATNGFAATDNGVYITYDGGNIWNLWDYGMPYGAFAKELDYVDNVATDGTISIIVSTYGNSIWARAIQVMGAGGSKTAQGLASSEKEFVELMQPFINNAGQLQVEYFTDRENLIQIEIYSALGEKIRVVENSQKNAGHYYSHVSINDLSKGMYIVNLRTADKSLSKKIVIN